MFNFFKKTAKMEFQGQPAELTPASKMRHLARIQRLHLAYNNTPKEEYLQEIEARKTALKEMGFAAPDNLKECELMMGLK